MPQTALKINDKNVVIITQQFDEELSINAYSADHNFIPLGEPILSSLKINEEEYHKTLRADANTHGHYVKGYSTNPEWNPDYNPEEYKRIESIISEEE
jgi:hypothetical protein